MFIFSNTTVGFKLMCIPESESYVKSDGVGVGVSTTGVEETDESVERISSRFRSSRFGGMFSAFDTRRIKLVSMETVNKFVETVKLRLHGDLYQTIS